MAPILRRTASELALQLRLYQAVPSLLLTSHLGMMTNVIKLVHPMGMGLVLYFLCYKRIPS